MPITHGPMSFSSVLNHPFVTVLILVVLPQRVGNGGWGKQFTYWTRQLLVSLRSYKHFPLIDFQIWSARQSDVGKRKMVSATACHSDPLLVRHLMPFQMSNWGHLFQLWALHNDIRETGSFAHFLVFDKEYFMEMNLSHGNACLVKMCRLHWVILSVINVRKQKRCQHGPLDVEVLDNWDRDKGLAWCHVWNSSPAFTRLLSTG